MARGSAQVVRQQFADYRWRLNNLYTIVDKEGRRVPFRTNWAQEKFLDEAAALNVILKARQLGFSTVIQLLLLDACLFTSDIRAGVIAHNLEDAGSIFKDKVRFAFDNLPEGLKAKRAAVDESQRELRFNNNSAIRVGTSMRSGTLQYLHVSEYGRICAQYPEKAREIRTGALNTLQAGQCVFIESTAQGQEGDFFAMCQQAQSLKRMGAKLTPLDFKFSFYPWHLHPDYELDPEGVAIEAPYQKYFRELEQKHGIALTPRKQAWYVKKAEQQKADMKREYPSTPDEAFESSIEGAYFAEQIARAEEQGRIGQVPHRPGYPVETWWDLGLNDLMAIWWVQRVGAAINVIDYYQNSDYGLEHYAGVLTDKRLERDMRYDEQGLLWPHDGNTKILDAKGSTRTEVMRQLGYQPKVLERRPVHDGIEAVRNILPTCYFDAERCALGLKALRNYRREWDEDRATWKDKPRHDQNSHAADAFRTGAQYVPARLRNPKFWSRPSSDLAPRSPIV